MILHFPLSASLLIIPARVVRTIVRFRLLSFYESQLYCADMVVLKAFTLVSLLSSFVTARIMYVTSSRNPLHD